MHKRILAAGLLLALYGATAAAQQLTSEDDKTLYALGVVLGNNVQDFNLTEAELALVAAGVKDGALGAEYKVDMEAYGPKIQEFASARASAGAAAEKEASAAFLAKMAKEPGAERSASGVIYIPETVGTGPSPTPDDTVRVHYHGTLRDGTVFDSSVDRGEPISFPLSGVIPCWTEGVQKMKVGGKAKLVCPSDTAYGDRGTGPIKPGAALMFEVQLLGIGDDAAK
jgi:FKBP-type peptidyl-prolyl cis-trans isomerase FkpA